MNKWILALGLITVFAFIGLFIAHATGSAILGLGLFPGIAGWWLGLNLDDIHEKYFGDKK